MKHLAWLLPLVAPVVHAVPANDAQVLLNQLGAGYGDFADQAMEQVGQVLHNAHEKVETWMHDGRDYIKQSGLTYELVKKPAFSDYQLRVTDPKICDTSVKQHSGYLDVTDGKHLFYWFFESRSKPADAPLILWINGGPGCSSQAGLLFELGPCRIADDGKNTTYNPHSWNAHANIIFLDQPVNVGYSYSDDGSTVNTSPVAGKDVHAFLQLFLQRFPQYAKAPFHLAAESYGGTYAPNIASVIHTANKAAAKTHSSEVTHINLASVVLANGLTDPFVQMGSVADYACDGPYPIYSDPNGPECQALRTKIPTCQRLIKSCYEYGSRFTCVPAALYCNSQLYGPMQQTGLNLYDVRKKCDRSKDKDGPMCYKEMEWVETWMNADENKKALGVNPDLKFQSCNMEVNQAFTFQGDGMHNSALLLPELVNDGVRLLVYAGDADAMCNYIGNERWVNELETKFTSEFQATTPLPWVTLDGGKVAGTVRAAGGGGATAGNVTFVRCYEAGHMVPWDQSEAAQDMITRWVMDYPLAL